MTKSKTSLSFSKEIAMDIGLKSAIFFHYICFWVQVNKLKDSAKHYKKGKYWTYGSDTYFSKEIFEFWSPSQIKHMRKKLLENKYIITGSFNAFGPDKTTWYTYTDKVYEVAGIKYIDKIVNRKKIKSQEKLTPW